jgi:hypothetical protein
VGWVEDQWKDAKDFVVDDVVNPVIGVIDSVVDAILDDPIKAAAQIAAIATNQYWALPLIEGADAVSEGAEIGEILERTAKAYVAQQVGGAVGQKAGTAAASAGAGEVASTVIGAGSGRAASAVVLGQDPVKAFVTGGISAGVPAALGQVDGFTDLPVAAQRVIESAITAELSGGDVDAAVIAGAIARASITADTVKTYASDYNLSDSEAALIADVVGNTAAAAFTGGNVSDAIKGSVMRYGAQELNKILDKNVRNTIDKVSGSYEKVESQARKLEELKDANLTAIDNYNAVVDRMSPRFARRDALFAEYEKAKTTYDADKTQATADALNAAVKKYNDYATTLDNDFAKTFKPELDKYEKQVNDTLVAFEKGTETYNTLREDLVSKSDQLGAELEPMYEATERAFVQAMDPNFNEAEYKELNGLGDDVNAYDHWLNEGQFEGLPTNMSNAEGTILSEKMRLLDDALESKGLSLSNLNTTQINNLYNDIDKKYGSDLNKLKNAQVNELDVNKAFKGVSAKTQGNATNNIYKPTANLPDGMTKATPEDIANGKARAVTVENGGLTWVTTTVPKGYYDPSTGEFKAGEAPTGVTSAIQPGYTLTQLRGVDPGSYLKTVAGGGDAIRDSVGDYVYNFAVNAMNAAKNTGNPLVINSAANALKASGGILKAYNGIVTAFGAVPQTTELGKFSKALIDLGAASNTEEFKATVAEMDKWRDADGWVDTAKALYGAFEDHPTEFLLEYVGVELTQELVPLLLGGIAKKGVEGFSKIVGMTEAFAKRFGAKAGISTAAISDVAESFGGTADSAYTEAFNVAKSQGLSDEEAEKTALEIAARAGTVSAMATAVSFGMGGNALAESVLGDKTTDAVTDVFNAFVKRIADGGTVVISEGITEGIEEGVTQLYLEGQLYQLDPDRPIMNNVAQATIFGAVIGSSVSGGIYSGAQVGDIVSNVLSTSNPKIRQLIETAPKDAAGAQQVQNTLNDLGITSSVTQTNILNEVYNPAYTSTGEAYQSFSNYEYYTPTEDEIYSFVGNVPDNVRESRIESYIDPRYVDADEIRAIAEQEGITLTDEQLNKYIGQKDESTTLNTARAEFDPQATTYEEAEQIFRDTYGYTPSAEEINQFVGAVPETDQRTAIGEYVNPRQVTEAEARAFFEEQGYIATDEEIQQFVGQVNQEARKTEIGEYVDPRMVDADEVRAAYEALGLTRPTEADVEQFIGQYAESDLTGRTEEYLPTARYNSVIEQLDALAENMGQDQEILDSIELVKQDFENQLKDLGYQLDDQTGVLSERITDVEASILEKVAEYEAAGIGRDEALQKAIDDVAGDLDTTKENILAELGATEESLLDTIKASEEVLGERITDVEASILEKVAEYEAAGATRDEALEQAIADVAGDLDTTKDDLLTSIGKTEESLAAQIGDVETALGEQITDVEASILEKVAEYEEAGIGRDEALQQAIDDVSTQLGTTEENLLAELGATEESLLDAITASETALGEQITDVEANILEKVAEYEAAGITRDEALQQAISDVSTQLGTTEENLLTELGATEESLLAELGATETRLGERITGVEETLGDDIQAVADLIGKPVQDVTDVDIDFVADLIAQQEALSDPSMFDFTQEQLGYDVTGDGIVNQLDLDLLTQAQQGKEVQFAPESKFAQPTGLYGTVQDTKTELEQAIDLSQQTLSQEIKEAEERQFKVGNLRQLQDMLMQAGDIGGQQVTVKSPDPAKIGYIYDFSSIFANPQQEALFGSPYAKGGYVEDPNDELLRLLGDK